MEMAWYRHERLDSIPLARPIPPAEEINQEPVMTLTTQARRAHPVNRNHAHKWLRAVCYLRRSSKRGWVLDRFIQKTIQ